MLAEALHIMCLPETNDLFVYVEESHYQELSRKKNPNKNKINQNKTEQEMRNSLPLLFLWNLKWEQERNYFIKWSKA